MKCFENEMRWKNAIVFIVFFGLAFGVSYAIYSNHGPKQDAAAANTAAAPGDGQAQAAATAQPAATKDGEIFVKRNCVACHSISSLGIHAGQVGPDLSQAYVTVKDKHGVAIEEFLKKPTSAVMSGVLGGDPLSDEDYKAVLAALKKAAGQ
ncbi:MAG TPA: c-type cytochrome [Bacilli bacterium]